MKKLLLTLTLLLLFTPVTVQAYTAGTPSTGGGGGSGGGSTEEPDPHPPHSTYTPKVTLLRNANALCANDGEAVYYVPTLDDLPLDIEAYVTDCTDGVNSHEFAYVYSGYFNSDAQLVTISSDSNTAEAHTSQNIETAYLSVPALKDIGYDLLLIDDTYDIDVQSDTYAKISNRHTAANSDNLSAKYVVMDIYKALGVYEYDIQFCFTRDPDFSANSSPILQEISVLTSQAGVSGLDIRESRTDVAVSRTNAELYWNRFDKDGVSRKTLSGSSVSGSQITGLASPISADSSISYGQFCNLAVALMNLYGEEALIEDDYQKCLRAYNSEISAIDCTSTVEKESAIYLLAKGILDPDVIGDIDWSGPVRLLDIAGSSLTDSNTIIDVLGRIANKDRRLSIKSPESIDSTLAAAGYGAATVAINTMISDYVEYSTDSSLLYDYLIEVVPDNTHKAVYKTANDVSGTIDVSTLETTASSVVQGITSVTEYDAYANMKMLVKDIPVEPATDLSYCLENGGYVYYGVTTIDDIEYYHFKVKKFWDDGSTVAIDYVPSNTEQLTYDVPEIVLPDLDGGVYSYEDGYYSKQTFSEASFDSSYIDSSVNQNMMLAGGNTTIMFYMTSKLNMNILSNFNDSTFTWTNIYNSNGTLKSGPQVISDRTDCYTTMNVASGTAEGDMERVEIITNNPTLVRGSAFFTQYSDGESYTTYGYYRPTDDGSLMISVTYLREKGLISGIKKLSSGSYVITAGKYKTNVTILPDKGYVIVGDTMYANTNGEILAIETGGDTYINYRCCLGWAADFSIISNEECVMAIPLHQFGLSAADINQETKSVTTFFPSASTKTLYNSFSNNGVEYSGFSMTGSYALAPYIIVMTDTNIDYLFVWHRDNLISHDGSNTYNISDEDDTTAREKFTELTGVVIHEQNNYSLAMFTLDRGGAENPAGFTYTNIVSKSSKGTRTATMGWLYEPPKFNNVLAALDTYASVSRGLAISIFSYDMGNGKSRYYDANINVSAMSTGNDYLPLGTMPSYMTTGNESKEEFYSKLTANGSYSTTTSAGESTKSYPVYTAPVGMFASIRGTDLEKSGKITSGTLYFGTSKCSVKDGQIMISSRATSFDSDSMAVCTYMSNDSSAVYAVTEDSTVLGDVLYDIDTSIGYLLDDPENLVDWDKYTFDRLVENLDAWSTVVLIFVLNILPRVCTLLFTALMLLSLISDLKPWQNFCRKWFDVYKFLTMGHMSVDTVDTKRVFIISLICTILFLMIMDGQLFNFIIWLCKFFIALYQR